MDKEVKKEWVAALRSGDYEQGQNALCANNKFCCLGVLVDIAYDGYWVQNTGNLSWGIQASESKGIMYGWLPSSFAKSLQLGPHANLIEMNDSGYNFEEIADHIEKNL